MIIRYSEAVATGFDRIERMRAGEFEEAVEADRILLARFPRSRHELRTRYTLGWAHFRQEESARAAEVFQAYVAQDSASIRAEGARLQWGRDQVGAGAGPADLPATG